MSRLGLCLFTGARRAATKTPDTPTPISAIPATTSIAVNPPSSPRSSTRSRERPARTSRTEPRSPRGRNRNGTTQPCHVLRNLDDAPICAQHALSRIRTLMQPMMRGSVDDWRAIGAEMRTARLGFFKRGRTWHPPERHRDRTAATTGRTHQMCVTRLPRAGCGQQRARAGPLTEDR